MGFSLVLGEALGVILFATREQSPVCIAVLGRRSTYAELNDYDHSLNQKAKHSGYRSYEEDLVISKISV